MPYFIFKVTQPTPIIKNLDFKKVYENYREARQYTRSLREDLPANSVITVKMIHAASQLEAEMQLQEKREKSIVKSWEK